MLSNQRKTYLIASIQSLLSTKESHLEYIGELKTRHYRGKVTDERIQTMENQINVIDTNINKLKEELNSCQSTQN